MDKVAEESFGGLQIAAPLEENINALAILIDCSRQIVSVSLYGDKHFVDMPSVTKAALAFFELANLVRPKLLAPLPNGHVSDSDAAVG